MRRQLHVADEFADDRGVVGQGQLVHEGAGLVEGEYRYQRADADGLLDERRHDPRRRYGHVHAPGLVEQPLVLRVVDACHGSGHAVLGFGQQRGHEVGLIVTGRGDDDIALAGSGLSQGIDIAGVGELPVGLGH